MGAITGLAKVLSVSLTVELGKLILLVVEGQCQLSSTRLGWRRRAKAVDKNEAHRTPQYTCWGKNTRDKQEEGWCSFTPFDVAAAGSPSSARGLVWHLEVDEHLRLDSLVAVAVYSARSLRLHTDLLPRLVSAWRRRRRVPKFAFGAFDAPAAVSPLRASC